MGMYRDGTDGDKASVYGAEYQTNTLSGYMLTVHDNDFPCAVCLVRNRSVVQMIPRKCIRWILRDDITKVKISAYLMKTKIIFRNKMEDLFLERCIFNEINIFNIKTYRFTTNF